MRIKGLVWLGIPADDYPAAVQFFTQTLGLAVAFDEADTVELSRKTMTGSSYSAQATAISSFTGAAARASFPCSKWTTLTKHATSWREEEPRSSVSRSLMGFGAG